ncbi:MAG: ATP-binding protein [Acidimicrobiia bacterium]|nr:ATP-binding protein [Acidimicrobiia bacterium]
MPSSTRVFVGGTSSVSAARRWVRRLLSDWDCDDLGPDAELVVSELAANAVEHEGSDLEIDVRLVADGVRISVSDRGHGDVTPVDGAHDRPAGRGLLIVEHVAERWGVDHHDRGKTVWAELVPGG